MRSAVVDRAVTGPFRNRFKNPALRKTNAPFVKRQNWVPNPEVNPSRNMGAFSAAGTGMSVTHGVEITDLPGWSYASEWTTSASGDRVFVNRTSGPTAGTYYGSVWVKTVGTYRVRLLTSGGGNLVSDTYIDTVGNGDWQLVTGVTGVSSGSGGLRLEVRRIGSVHGTIQATGWTIATAPGEPFRGDAPFTRTNLLTDPHLTSSWTPNSTTISSVAVSDLPGFSSAIQFTVNASADGIYQVMTTPAGDWSRLFFSGWVKIPVGGRLSFRMTNTSGSIPGGWDEHRRVIDGTGEWQYVHDSWANIPPETDFRAWLYVNSAAPGNVPFQAAGLTLSTVQGPAMTAASEQVARVNLFANSDCEYDVNGYNSSSSMTGSRYVDPDTGETWFRAVLNSNTTTGGAFVDFGRSDRVQHIKVEGGKRYTVSFLGMLSRAAKMRLLARFYNASGTEVGGGFYDLDANGVDIPANQWVRYTAQYTAPSGAEKVRFAWIGAPAGTSWPSGNWIAARRVTVEETMVLGRELIPSGAFEGLTYSWVSNWCVENASVPQQLTPAAAGVTAWQKPRWNHDGFAVRAFSEVEPSDGGALRLTGYDLIEGAPYTATARLWLSEAQTTSDPLARRIYIDGSLQSEQAPNTAGPHVIRFPFICPSRVYRTNEVPNPKAATNVTGWSAWAGSSSTVSRVTVEDLPGYTHAFRINPTTASDRLFSGEMTGVGVRYMSAWVKAPAGLVFRLEAAAGGATNYPGVPSVQHTGTGDWVEVHAPDFVALSDTPYRLRLICSGSSTAWGYVYLTGATCAALPGGPMVDASELYWEPQLMLPTGGPGDAAVEWDSVSIIESRNYPGSAFDGWSPVGRWLGTADESESVAYLRR